MTISLSPLPYAADALEPYLKKEIVEIHYQKHHQSYVDGYNSVQQKLEAARTNKDFATIKHLSKDLAFHASGNILHTLYWENLAPAKEALPGTLTQKVITEQFGDMENFKKEVGEVAKTVEGSGWAVVVYSQGQLEILGCEKHQDVTIWGSTPILVCDVWEHAYYLQYQNRRAEYIENFWKIVNWEMIENRLKKAVG